MRRRLLWVAAGTTAVTVLAVTAVTAFACVPIAILRLSADQLAVNQLVPVPQVAPGGQVSAYIHEISGSSNPPVTFHWDAVDGPVLATVQPSDDTPGVKATLTVPQSATPGAHLIIATEPAVPAAAKGENPTWGMPVRAAVFVTGGSGSAPVASTVAPGVAGLGSDSGVSVGVLMLIAAATAVAGIAIATAAAWTLRRRESGQPASTR